MRILQIAPLMERVPPEAYGGTEAVVSLLSDALVEQGHDVVLWASADSRTEAELRSVYPQSLRSAPVDDPTLYGLVHAAQALDEARDFDLVHNHAGETAMSMCQLCQVPMLTTMHCLIDEQNRFVWDWYPGHYNTISQAESRTVPPLDWAKFEGVVYNAIDVYAFTFCREKDDYLLHLSRIAAAKGTHLAIEAARKAGRQLVIAGKVDAVDEEYFEQAVAPLIDDRQIRFLGEADHDMKVDLYQRAAGMLLPLTWEEPFGLVIAEAMACGTPVIAFPRGAAPEIVVDGQTGFLAPDTESMADAIGRLGEIDPQACREHVEANFGKDQMVKGYVQLYERILSNVNNG